MPFGLRNAPAIFQRTVNNILKKHNLTSFCKNYLDDNLIHSENIDIPLEHLKKFFEALFKENIKLKLSKCQFAQNEAVYLGHIITKNKIQPLNDNTKFINDFSAPRKVKTLSRFLGKVNFYHKFISNAPTLLEPLYRLLQKKQEFKRTEECEDSFLKIKFFLIKQPILAVFNPHAPCYLRCL